MVSTTVIGRITITAPDDIHAKVEDRARGGPVRTGGAVPLPGRSSSASLDAALIDALREQALTPGENVILTGPAAPRSRRASGSPETAQVSVAVSPGEQAVALLEQDGVYNWVLASGGADTSGGVERRGGATGASIQFEIPLGVSLPDAAGRRSVLGDLVFTPIRVRIFRFLGRQAVGAAVGFQERTIVPGLVRVDGPDPTAWTVGDPIRVPPPRSGTRHRVLLLVHGTFSSTAGGFGQLAVTPWGAAFLAACAATYDLVLGYDHRTLSEDPEQNARHLLAAVRGLDWGGAPPEIDLIAHSRGGLVVRTLVEALAPESGWDARFGRAILVGTTNAGTELASPSNWGAFVDLYTNLAVAACRALALLPQAAPVVGILRGTVASLGEFIKQIALGGLDGDLAPGLAAMVPTGDFVRRLNQTQTRQFDAAHSIYRVVSSAFVPRLTGSDHEPKELPRRFLHLLGSAAVTGLMKGVANDLVVDTNSMSAIDVAFGNFVCDSLHFAESPQIYHTNYFSRPEVVTALGRWLGLAEPTGVPATAPAANPQGRGGGARRSPAEPPPASAVFGGPFVPAAVDTRVVVVSAADPARAAATAIRKSSARFVVVSREHEGQVLNYAYDPDELGPSFAAGADHSLLEVLNLHEAGADRTLGLGQAAAQAAAGRLLFETGQNAAGRPRRTVVTEGARTIGVVPSAAEAVIGADIGALARDVAAGTRGITRRVMPPLRTLDPVPAGAKAPASARRGGTTRSSAMRGRTDGTERPPEPIECHFLAETVPTVRLGSTLSIHVTVTREAVAAALGLNTWAVVSLDPNKKIIIDVWPKRGFEMAEDEEPAFIDPPAPGTPAEAYFTLRSVAVGAGEIWVVARQGKLPLVTLKLRPEVVERHAEPERGRKLIAEKRAITSGGVSPKHALTILEADPTGTQSIFRFELDSPNLGVLKRYESKPIRGDRQAYVEGLYRQIEEAWTGTVTQKRAEDFAEKLRDMGTKLWKSLLPEDLQADLWRNRTCLDSIFILSEEPFIPWELLFMVEPGKARTDEGCFLAELGLVRWLYEAEAAPPTALVVREGRARYIIPEYPKIPEINLYPLPEAEAEREFLTEKFRATGVEPQPAPVGALLAGPDAFDLLHFAGHGFAARSVAEEAQILLGGDIVGDAYRQNVLEAARIETKADFGASRPSVIINACQAGRADWKLTGMGGFAQAFLARKAGLFVGTLWSVGDHPARAFTEAFYLALLGGKDVAAAVCEARQTARTAEDPTWLAYAVYAHPNAVLAMDDALMDDAPGTAPAARQGGAP